jgi:hypothetical protein
MIDGLNLSGKFEGPKRAAVQALVLPARGIDGASES